MNQISFRWDFPAYIKHSRSLVWHIIAGLVLAGFLVYALADSNFLFAAILLLFAFIFLFQDRNDPIVKQCIISSKGINIDGNLAEFSDLKKFWMIYEPPKSKNLYLDFQSGLKPRLTIPLEDQNPVIIREFLLQYIDEDLERQAEPITEQVGRLLKL